MRRADGGSGAAQAAADPAAAWLSTLVYEALDKVASPDARNELIHAALRRASLEAMPGAPAELLDFAVGPLRAAVADGLGEEAGEALVQDLAPILQHAAAAATPPAGPEPASEAASAAEPGAPAEPEPIELDLDASAPAEPEPVAESEAVAEPDVATETASEPIELDLDDGPPAQRATAPARRRNTMPLAVQQERARDHATPVQPVQREAEGLDDDRHLRRMRSTFPYQDAVLQGADERSAVIVDDERAFLRGYSVALRCRQVEVFTARNASDAIALCRRVEPSYVLLDAAMPEAAPDRLLASLEQALVGPATTVVVVLWQQLPAAPPSSPLARHLEKPSDPAAVLDELGIEAE